MSKPAQERRQSILFYFIFVMSVISIIAVWALIGLNAYIRWGINANFSLLSGFELEVLTVSAFALLFGMACLYRPDKNLN